MVGAEHGRKCSICMLFMNFLYVYTTFMSILAIVTVKPCPHCRRKVRLSPNSNFEVHEKRRFKSYNFKLHPSFDDTTIYMAPEHVHEVTTTAPYTRFTR